MVNRDEFTMEAMEEKISRINLFFPANIQMVYCKKYAVSSTEIRSGMKLEDVLPEVREYIFQNHLYGL